MPYYAAFAEHAGTEAGGGAGCADLSAYQPGDDNGVRTPGGSAGAENIIGSANTPGARATGEEHYFRKVENRHHSYTGSLFVAAVPAGIYSKISEGAPDHT